MAALVCALALAPAHAVAAQEAGPVASHTTILPGSAPPLERAPPTRADSLAAEGARAAASRDAGLRIVVSIAERRLWVMDAGDTLMTASAGVGMDRRLTYDARSWTFRSPRGIRAVKGKMMRDAWIPPDWHYAEVAREYHLRLASLPADSNVVLADGTILTVRGGEAGLLRPDGSFAALPQGEEIVFDSTLYIPPMGTGNRAVHGELGRHQLDLGDGYLIHGTPLKESIGTATTHGCVRLDDAEIEWLYAHIPVGTPVYIY
ncbi:MAG TPA: L,D-transpeptidase [Gemmatimonadaceae bacterium]